MYRKITYLFILFSLFNCKENAKQEKKVFISKINLKKDLSVLTKKMTDMDTIKINVNLTMEWWNRIDNIILTKNDSSVFIETTSKESVDGIDPEFEVEKLRKVRIDTTKINLEKLFIDNLYRTDSIKYKHSWIYKIINGKDTLTFYSYGLGDKGLSIDDYYSLMKQFYPYNERFVEIKILEEGTDPLLKYKNQNIKVGNKEVDYSNLFEADSIHVVFIPIRNSGFNSEWLEGEKNLDTISDKMISFYDSIAMKHLNRNYIKFIKTNKRYIRFLTNNGEKIFIDTDKIGNQQTIIFANNKNSFSIQSKDLVSYIFE